MKKLRKKMIAMLLVVIMIVSAAPLGTLAEMGWMTIRASAKSYSGYCGENVTWTIDEYATLTIDGTGEMEDYPLNNAPWYSFRNAIRQILISDGVTHVGSYAFRACYAATDVNIPTSVVSIGDFAFYGCESLSEIEIGQSVVQVGECAFKNTGYSYNEENWIDGVLYLNTLLLSANASCSDSITVLEETTCVAPYAFCENTNITEISLSDNVQDIGAGAFYNCSRLSKIKLSANLRHIGEDAFFGTSLYTNADNWTDGVLYIDNSLITTDRILSGTYAVREGTVCLADSALKDCNNLSNLEIPASVRGIGSVNFYGCDSLSEIHVNAENCFYSSDETGVLFNKGKSVLIRCPANNPVTQFFVPNSVQEIGDSAFYGCDLLQSISIPNNVWGIGDNAFYSCTSLQSVSIPEGICQISNSCFYYCRRLSTIFLPSSITVIGENAFDSSGIKWIFLGDNVEEIKRYAFNNTAIQNISFGSSITKIAEHAFGACFSLKSVCYSGTVEQWMEIEISSDANNALTTAPRYYHTHTPEMSTELRNTVEATCYRDGYSGDLVYLPCGAIKETGVIIPALGHDFVTTIPEPTCEYEVWGSVICSRCGTHDSGSEPRIPPLGHDWDDGIVTREATCVLSGITKYTCLRDSSHTRTEYTPAKGHMFGEWQETKAPTVDQPGEAQKRCSVCGKIEMITLAKLPTPEKLTLNKTSVALNFKDSETLTASEAVTWTSSNEKVVKVDAATGQLTTIGKGTATITAHSVQGNKTATCEVTVKYTFIQMLIRIFLLGFIWY